MSRPALSSLRSLHRHLLGFCSCSSLPSSSSFSHPFLHSTSSSYHHLHQSRSPIFPHCSFGSAYPGSIPISPHFGTQVKEFSASDTEQSGGREDAVLVEYVEVDRPQEEIVFRRDYGSSRHRQGFQRPLLGEAKEEEGMLFESLHEELYSCEGLEEGILEDSDPHPGLEGRSYLHVLSVEEMQVILETVRAEDVQVIPVRDLCEWADHLIVTSGRSSRHLRGIANAIVFEVKKRSTNVGNNLYPTVEGRDCDQWMVVDCGSIVVHVFREDVRSYYNLEDLWRKRRATNLRDIGL